MPKSSRKFRVEFFIPRKGISATVLKRDLASYIGDAEIRLTHLEGREGFLIKANQALNKHQLADLKANSVRLEAERASVDEDVAAIDPRYSKEHRSPSSTLQDRSYHTANTAASYDSERRQRPYSTQYENIQGARLSHGLAQSRRPQPTFAKSYTASPAPTYGRGSYFAEYEESDSGYGSRQGSSRSSTQGVPYDTRSRYSDDSGLPAIDEMQLSDRGSRRGSDDGSYTSTRDDQRHRSYRNVTRRDPYDEYYAKDQKREVIIPQSGSRLGPGFSRDPRDERHKLCYDEEEEAEEERETGSADHRVLLDETDSVTGTRRVLRDPREPVRSRSSRHSEESRRLRDFALQEDAEEQTTFRRERSRDRLKYEDYDDDNEEEGDYSYGARSGKGTNRDRPRHFAQDTSSDAYRTSYPDDRISAGRYDDDDEGREPPWAGTPGFSNQVFTKDDDGEREPPWGTTPGFKRYNTGTSNSTYKILRR